MKEIPDLYEYMNSAGAKAKTRNVEGIKVDTRFRGSRENPSLRGKMEGLSPDNFNAGELVLGVLTGISAELFEFYQEFEGTENTVQKNLHSHITGSGNGIRRNPLLQEIFKEQFGKEMRIPVCAEEASYGSALFSLYSADIYNSLIELQRMVQ